MKTKKFIPVLFIILFVLMSEYCFARAGGGGSGGGISVLGIIIGIIIAPFVIIYQAIVNSRLKKKHKKAKQMISEISQKDKMWNYRTLIARVEETFFKVQKAWTDRDQDYAKDCMTNRIYNKHKIQTDEMIDNGTINVLERVNLIESTIYSISDYKDDSLDTFSVRIKASMLDYHINENTKDVVSGDSSKATTFAEIWTFVREEDKWMLDEIDQKVSLSDVKQGEIYSEG